MASPASIRALEPEPITFPKQMLLVTRNFIASVLWFAVGACIYSLIAIKIHDWLGESSGEALEGRQPG